MDYVRPLDSSKFDPTRFHVLTLAGRESGCDSALFRVARVPPRSVATEQAHTHATDKFYYILSGEMCLEVDGQRSTAGPNTLVYVPAGVPHRNWNEGDEPELHIVVFVPEPEAGRPLTIPVSS